MQDNTQSRRAFIGLIAASIAGAFVPTIALAQVDIGEITQQDGRSRSSGQEFPLTVLIGQQAETRNAGFLANQAYNRGKSYISQRANGGNAYNWQIPLGFVFSPSLQWYARSWDDLLISTQWQFYKNGVGVSEMEDIKWRLSNGVGSSGQFSANQIQGTWYAMAVSAASVKFVANLSSLVSRRLKGKTFSSVDAGYQSVANELAMIGDAQLNQMYSDCLFDALNDRYIPLQSTGSLKESKTLMEFSTLNNGNFRFVEGKGWEQIKGVPVFSAGGGVIDGAVSKIAIGFGRDSTFTTKDKGRK
jgi:hypothetical protein